MLHTSLYIHGTLQQKEIKTRICPNSELLRLCNDKKYRQCMKVNYRNCLARPILTTEIVWQKVRCYEHILFSLAGTGFKLTIYKANKETTMLSTSGKQLCPNIRWAWDRGIKNTKMCRGGVVKWIACSPSTLTIRFRIPLKSTNFLLKEMKCEMNKNKQKEAGVWLI